MFNIESARVAAGVIEARGYSATRIRPSLRRDEKERAELCCLTRADGLIESKLECTRKSFDVTLMMGGREVGEGGRVLVGLSNVGMDHVGSGN